MSLTSPIKIDIPGVGSIESNDLYLKSEVDRCFKELKSEIERLEILCADYRHDCDNLAISNEQVKRAASTLLKKMNHNKYKRCLAMAEMRNARHDEEDAKVNGHGASREYESKEMKYWERWHERWLAIAEKFKEVK